MADQPKRLKVNDEVFIESHGMMGKVVQVRRDGDDEPFYQVQIEHYFRRDDLELIDREADQQKRREELLAKVERRDDAYARVMSIVDAGGTLDAATTKEFCEATNELWQAYGHGPLFIPKNSKI